MRKLFALGAWLCLTWAAAGGTAQATTTQAVELGGSEAAQNCCKICSKGKACGNSCISREKQCHQPPGCACDG